MSSTHPLVDFTSADKWLRHQAWIRLEHRGGADERLLLALLLYEELFASLDPGQQYGAPQWRAFSSLPEDLRRTSARKARATFIRRQVRDGDVERLPGLLREVHDHGAAAVSARLSSLEPPVIVLPPRSEPRSSDKRRSISTGA